MPSEIVDVAPGLWLWRLRHPAWEEGNDWEPFVTSTCVESGGEVVLLDPLAPPEDGDPVWARLDAGPPTVVVILKPDHVRDVDLFVRRYGARAYGPRLFWRDDIPDTELIGVDPGDELPGGLVALYDGRNRLETPLCSTSRSSTWSSPTASRCTTAPPTSAPSSWRRGRRSSEPRSAQAPSVLGSSTSNWTSRP